MKSGNFAIGSWLSAPYETDLRLLIRHSPFIFIIFWPLCPASFEANLAYGTAPSSAFSMPNWMDSSDGVL
jgi:hypothetical protein